MIQFDNLHVKQILAKLGNPQYKYRVIHIAGTNGKGSTAAFIECVLIASGYQVGKYTSPYNDVVNDTIMHNMTMISDVDLAYYTSYINRYSHSLQIPLSDFELLTIVMFIYFADKNIDILVLETGMGGLYDATNVVNSEFSIITNIALEHTEYLGDTLFDIARHKSGIINHGLTITGDHTPELLHAIMSRTNNYVNVLDKYEFKVELDVNSFLTKLYLGQQLFALPLFGAFQAKNFLCAYEVFVRLNIDSQFIVSGLNNLRWPRRIQPVGVDPIIIEDVTHNLHGMIALRHTMQLMYSPNDVVVIFGCLFDKDISSMLHEIANFSNTVIFIDTFEARRATPTIEYTKFAQLFKYTTIRQHKQEAISFARSLNKPLILVTGSHYIYHDKGV